MNTAELRTPISLSQVAPYPEELHALVRALRYRPGWTFELIDRDRGQGSAGLTLDVITSGFNSYHPDQARTIASTTT